METVVYLIRHSEKLRNNFYSEYNVREDWKARDEKKPLSTRGEELAKEYLSNKEFDNVDVIYSSHYSRTISTAKYLAERLDLNINIDSRLQERMHGDINLVSPQVFYYTQHHDFDYKLRNGESINDTRKRMIEIFNEIIFTHHEKNIALFTHEHAIISFLTEFCEVGYSLEDELVLTYGDSNFVGFWNQPDGVKVTVLDNEVINIERIN